VNPGASGDPRIAIASRNAHKIAEIERILRATGLSVELVSADEAAPGLGDIPETGRTFEDNALIKARAVSAASGLPAIADDSGLAVDELNGMPGVLSARWCGHHDDDLANLELVLAQIADTPDERRGAQFICVAVLVRPDGEWMSETGVVAGSLLRSPRGINGFGYDPIFVPEGESRTTAEMSSDEKDKISHRGRAFRALAARLHELI
jgi:XTP/dITP diphosphohydrolase